MKLLYFALGTFAAARGLYLAIEKKERLLPALYLVIVTLAAVLLALGGN